MTAPRKQQGSPVPHVERECPTAADSTGATGATKRPRGVGLPTARRLTPPTLTHEAAAAVLAERDPVLARLIAIVGPPTLRPPHDSHFAALVRAITYQQLAGPAATAIHGRLVALLADDVSPERVLAQSRGALRSVGLSEAKALSITDLAAKTTDGTVVLDRRGIARLSDEEIIARLSTVRGIGRWTAEMFLMFQLQRLDVWPTGDLGVRKGYGLIYGVATPTPKELIDLGERFRPYRSVAAWFCWRAVEQARQTGPTAVTA
jgi:DNA-3-methyladenine glycosylase II